MNQKKRNVFILAGLVFFLTLAVVFVRRTQLGRAEAEVIRRKVALASPMVNDKEQLEQVVTIQQQVRKNQPLSDEQVAQLLAVVDGPPDSILKAKAIATLMYAAPRGTITSAQKTKIIASATRALKDPDSLVRAYAISLLRSFDDPKVIPTLRPLLQDSDQGVRFKAQQSIGDLEKIAPTTPAK